MATVLGDVRRDGRQLRDLMPAWSPNGMARVQAPRAAATRLRREIDDRVYALDGHQLAMVSRMTRLPAGLASTLSATTARALLSRKAVGGRRLRRDDGILLPERELTLKIGNPLRLLLELLPKALVLLAQPLDFLRLAIMRVARWLVTSRPLLAPSNQRRERTKSLQKYKYKIVPSVRGPELLPTDTSPSSRPRTGPTRSRLAPPPDAPHASASSVPRSRSMTVFVGRIPRLYATGLASRLQGGGLAVVPRPG